MPDDVYNSIAAPVEGYFRDRGSKFYAFAYPASSEEEVKQYLAALKKEHYNANHHVYAFKLGAGEGFYRASDDGEPANSSGKPVLGQILSYGLSDVLVVVVRYFGGVKLGVPGLIHAYRSAADDALQKTVIVEKTVTQALCIKFDYPLMSQVTRLIDEEKIEVARREFAQHCNMTLKVRLSVYERILERFAQLYGVNILKHES